jgi:N-acetylglucosaminyldiphosphoundecaprenol N-acetyl-beta-D-mannosaminyltransferase
MSQYSNTLEIADLAQQEQLQPSLAGRILPPFYRFRPYPRKVPPAAKTPFWQTHPLVRGRRRVFLETPLHALTMAETLDLAEQAMTNREPLHHTVINVSKLVNMRANPVLAQDVSEADLINVDGAGVVWGARLFGVGVPERVAGVDIMEAMFRICAERGFRPYLLGAEAHVLDAVKKRLARDYPGFEIAGARDGYFSAEDEEGIILDINASGADCLFVALPTPRKERFLYRYRLVLRPYFIMGVGGSFDVYGGKVHRAPKWVQAIGMEWAYRVMQEPGRLWRRYWDTNRAYLKLLWTNYWRTKRPHHAR